MSFICKLIISYFFAERKTVYNDMGLANFHWTNSLKL